MTNAFDAIVVGARCAGSPVAMLLARKGYRVLVVDRATFPSDTVSTHLVHPLGVAALDRWGLLARLVATGCPPVHTYAFDFGPFALAGAPGTEDPPVAYVLAVRSSTRSCSMRRQQQAPRSARASSSPTSSSRTAASWASRVARAEGSVMDRATIVVGADGGIRAWRRASSRTYHEKPRLLVGYYSYWSDLPMEGRFEAYIRWRSCLRRGRPVTVLTLVIGGWP